MSNRKNPRPFAAGAIVTPVRLIKGYPLSVGPDTRLVIRELDRSLKRYRCERDDGRQGTWWVDHADIRPYGYS